MFKSYFLLTLSIIVTLFVSNLIYRNVEWFFQYSLQKRVKAIAVTASLQFDPKVLDNIKDINSVPESSYIQTVIKLQKIRENNQDLRFIYIQKKTQNPNQLLFVADADSLNPNGKIDLNRDGIIDDSDALNYPGQEYDVSEYPEFAKIAFKEPYVDEQLSVDQWGTHLSATAPIFLNDNNNAEYILGIDVDVSDFSRITKLAYIPFILFIAFLLLVLINLTFSLVKMWSFQLRILKELDRQKDELLSIVAHQLLTPVTAMRWSAEALLDEKEHLTEDQIDMSHTIEHQSTQLADLIGVILDVSRIQLDRLPIKRGRVQLRNFYDDILSVIKLKAQEKNVHLNIHLPHLLPEAEIDERYTRMAVENLLSNAVKYTPADGVVTLDVQIKDCWMYLKVTDTGVGIPKQDQEKIFGKMFRASNVTGSIEGNGFGLYVAKGSVNAQGGEIGFESTEGKGTTFWIRMPLDQSTAEKARKSSKKGSLMARIFGQRKMTK